MLIVFKLVGLHRRGVNWWTGGMFVIYMLAVNWWHVFGHVLCPYVGDTHVFGLVLYICL